MTTAALIDRGMGRIDRLTLRTCDGLELAGWRWRAAEPRAGVVLVHGFVGRGRSPALLAHVRALVADGYDVVAYDARGHGDSGGECSLGDLEHRDVAAAAEAAAERTGRVVLVGESMGGAAVLAHATTAPGGLYGLVTVGSPANWRMKPTGRAVIAAALTHTGVGRRLARRSLGVAIRRPTWKLPEPPERHAARLNVPYAVVHGGDDRFIPVGEALRLHRRAGGPSRLRVVDRMGHGFGAGSVEPVQAAVSWVLANAGVVVAVSRP